MHSGNNFGRLLVLQDGDVRLRALQKEAMGLGKQRLTSAKRVLDLFAKALTVLQDLEKNIKASRTLGVAMGSQQQMHKSCISGQGSVVSLLPWSNLGTGPP